VIIILLILVNENDRTCATVDKIHLIGKSSL